jgi:putative transcriptional regulator
MSKKPARNSNEAADHRQRSAKRAPSSAAGKSSPAGAKIVGAFEEATGPVRKGEPLEQPFTVRTYNAKFTPRDYGPDDVRRVRDLLGMSQVVFARFLGIAANTVRSWEQGTRLPSPIARRFMDEIEGAPEHWRQRIVQNAISEESKPVNR